MNTKEIIKKTDKYLLGTYKRFPVVFEKGRGSWLTDSDGNKYLDYVGGIAVNSLGHGNTGIKKAVQTQSAKFSHISNLYYYESTAELAELVVKNTFPSRVFFCNSGAEANEGAIKFARKYSYSKFGKGRNLILSLNGSFHGRLYGSLAATGQKALREGFGPFPGGFKHIPPNDEAALEKALSEKVCAIIAEPILAEGGVIPLRKDYAKKLRELCNKNDVLLIMDEVQTGLGRTGDLFGYVGLGIKPDIVSMAKPLGGGLPLGAVQVSSSVAKHISAGDHGSTFGGNPVSCAAGVSAFNQVLEIIKSGRAEEVSGYLEKKLVEIVDASSKVTDLSGRGFIWGLKYNGDPAGVIKKCMDEGLLIYKAGKDIVRILPPLNTTRSEINKACSILKKVL
ncbi:MAG: aspartate aminotransferase family protein [Fibrobacterota bacterium]